MGLYSAQAVDIFAGSLNGTGAYGGPAYLSGLTPGLLGTPSFLEYSTWSDAVWFFPGGLQQLSIARGETIFNTRTFTISNVAGFNDVSFVGNGFKGTCATCHIQAGSGSDVFVNSERDLGVAGDSAAALPSPDLPLFKLTCVGGKTHLSMAQPFLPATRVRLSLAASAPISAKSKFHNCERSVRGRLTFTTVPPRNSATC